jgi:phytoene dehydrogenase-like protein
VAAARRHCKLAAALVSLVTAHRGEIRTGTVVDSILVDNGRATGVRTDDNQEFTATTAVVATGTPDRVYGHLLRDAPAVPQGVRAQTARYRCRRGCFQLNLALSARPRFHDPRLDNGGGINLGRGVDELLASVRQAQDGLLPAHPAISWHEPTALDPDRAPAGKAVVRLQVLDTPLHPIGDAAGTVTADGEWDVSTTERFADRIIAEAGEHVPGLADLVLARHILSPADIAASNPDNAGPGDHGSGHNALAQGFTQRPIAAHRGGYASAVPGLCLIGGASRPGPGISGSSGRAVAKALLGS